MTLLDDFIEWLKSIIETLTTPKPSIPSRLDITQRYFDVMNVHAWIKTPEKERVKEEMKGGVSIMEGRPFEPPKISAWFISPEKERIVEREVMREEPKILSTEIMTEIKEATMTQPAKTTYIQPAKTTYTPKTTKEISYIQPSGEIIQTRTLATKYEVL